MPVEFEPPRVAIVVDKSTWTRELIEHNGKFGIVIPGVAATNWTWAVGSVSGFHEEPQVLHYDSRETNVVLKPGMTFTIEPMVNAGKKEIRTMKDGWTVKTKDRSLSAQYEHTIVVTDNGCEILTLRKDDTIPAIISHDE